MSWTYTNPNGGTIIRDGEATPQARVEQAILSCFDDGYEPEPREVAEVLVDEDVAAGLYEGCSSELEGWFCEFERIAEQMLTLRTRADTRRRLDDLGRQPAAHNQRLHEGGA